MENLGATIDKAVDSAVATASTPGHESTPRTPAAKTSESPATASLPVAPASRSGSEPDSTTPAVPPSKATQPPASDDEILRDNTAWLTLEKRQTTLSNARTKAATEARAQLFQELGIDGDGRRMAELAPHARLLLSDPVEYHRQLGESLRRDGLLREEPPTHAPKPATTAARTAASPFALPEPRLQTPDGVGVYGTDEVKGIVENLLGHIDSILDERLQPHEKTRERMESERLWAEADRLAVNDIATAKSWPMFDQLSKRIGELMSEAVRNKQSLPIKDAYNAAYVEYSHREAPNTEATIRARLLEELNQQPAGDIARPNAPAVHAREPRRARTLNEEIDRAVERAARG
jgi:hypothetical protein